MDFSRLLISGILGITGFSITLYLLALLFRPVVRSAAGRQYSQRLRRAADKILQSDALFAGHQHLEALKALRKAPVYEIFDRSQFIDPVREHHQNILSRCVLIAEELQTRVDNLPEVERMVMERSELQSLYVRATESFASLKNRREKAGKEIPSWSKTDFDKRIKDIRKELEANRVALMAGFEKLFNSIESSRREEDIVYH